MPRTDGYNTAQMDDGSDARANAIKAIYYDVLSQLQKVNARRNNPQWDGGLDRFGVKHVSIWKRLLKFLDKNQIHDYVGYICNSLLFYLPGQVYPSYLLSEKALNAYKAAQEEIRRTFKEKFRHALVTLRVRASNFLLLGASPQDALKKGFADSAAAFDPVIRAALAMIYDIPGFDSDARALARIYYSICADFYEQQIPGLGEFVGYQEFYIPQTE